MGGTNVTEDTFTRKLPYSIMMKLSSLLDIGQLWEKLVVNIPRKLDMLTSKSDEFEAKYDYSFVAMVEARSRRPGVSPTRLILDEWATQNVQLKHLIRVLELSELYAAADLLAVDVLKGEPVPRPQSTENTIPEKDDIKSVYGKEYHSNETIYERKQCVGVAVSACPEQSIEVDHMSMVSGHPSADLKAGAYPESPREPSESDEIVEVGDMLQGLRSDKDIRSMQHLDYKLLKSITGNFNDADFSKGGNMLGRGGFGTVYIGQFNNGFKIAVKCLKEENEENLKQFKTELEVLSQYRHENIVHLLGYSQEDTNHCLIYQYMPNGSLEDRINCKDGTEPLDCKTRINIAQGTARGISYLNGEGLVHRDIKSANVLLDKDFQAKVGDFATARIAPKGIGNTLAVTSIVIGTSAYLAPEAYQFDVSAKLDTFSYGVVLLELITGLPSFDPGRDDRDLWSHIQETCDNILDIVDHKAGSWSEETVTALYDIATRCLHKKKARPLVEEILPELESLSSE